MSYVYGSWSKSGVSTNWFGIKSYRMNPFPYRSYYVDSDSVPPYSNTYYNDPNLDAVKLVLTLAGDPEAWNDPLAYYELGLLTTTTNTFNASGGIVDLSYDTINLWAYYSAFDITDPSLKLKYYDPNQGLASPGVGIREYPGVASSLGFSPYNIAVCYGRPIKYELEFKSNQLQQNKYITYSGYTNFGDFNGYEFPQPYGNTQPGYVRRYAAGIIKKDADISNCLPEDMEYGVILTGTASSCTGFIVINGNIMSSLPLNEKASEVYAYGDTVWSGSFNNLNNFAQSFDDIGLVVTTSTSYVSIYLENATFDPPDYVLDVFNVKWAWYYDFVADAGEGVNCGTVECVSPMMYTHPGWPILTLHCIATTSTTSTQTIGTIQDLNVIAQCSAGTFPVTDVCSYESSDKNVLTVNSLGQIQGVYPGTAEVIISYQNFTTTYSVSMVYGPTTVVTNQAELDAELAKSASLLNGAVIGVTYNPTPYTIDRTQLRKNYGDKGLVITSHGTSTAVFKSIEIEGVNNFTLYNLEAYDSTGTSFAMITPYSSSVDVNILNCTIHGKYYDPNGDYSLTGEPANSHGIYYMTNSTKYISNINIKDCVIYDVTEGIALNYLGGDTVITGNEIYNCYNNNIKIGCSSSTSTSILIGWNELYQVFGLSTDAGNPHPDHIQFVGSNISMNNIDIIGNIIFTGNCRGEGQGIFLDDLSTGTYFNARIKGNVVATGITRGISVRQARDCEIIGNTVVAGDIDQNSDIIILIGDDTSTGTHIVRNNASYRISINGSTDASNNLLFSQTTASYQAIFYGPNFNKAALTTTNEILYAFYPSNTSTLYSTINIGAIGSGYVDFYNRTLNTAMEVSPEPWWVYEGLEIGANTGTVVGKSLRWTDESGGSNSYNWSDSDGGYVTLTYNSANTSGLEWDFPNTSTYQVWVKYDVQRSSTKASKQLKIFSQGSPTNPSNATFGPTSGGYTNATSYSVYYSDRVAGGDNQVAYLMTGALTGGAVLSRDGPTKVITSTSVSQSTTGTVWETYEVFIKFNDEGAKNGEIAIRKDGVTRLYLTDVWNAGEGNEALFRMRDYISLGAYSATSGFSEKYRKFKVSYDRPYWLPTAPDVVFSDSFASDNLSRDVGPATWNAPVNTQVYANRGKGYNTTTFATSALQFTFNGTAPGGDAWAEQRFDLGRVYPELLISFDMYIPDGTEAWGGAAYNHRVESPGNNKFFRLWGTGYNDREKVGASLFPDSTGTSYSKIRAEWSVGGGGIGEKGVARTPFITTLGTWTSVKIYAKAATTDQYGSMKIWKDDTLVLDNTYGINNYTTGEAHGYRYGYLLGWANSGFTNTTYILLDNVSISTPQPARILDGIPVYALYNQPADGIIYPSSNNSRVTYSSTATYNDNTALKVQLLQTPGPLTCGGSHNFAWRQNLPTNIPEGHTLWMRAKVYIPSTTPLGYAYGNDPEGKFSGSYTTGSTVITLLTNSGSSLTTYSEGDNFAIQLDDDTYHFTTIVTKASNTATIADPLPSPATSTATNTIYIGDSADALQCGEIDNRTYYADSGGTLKFFCTMPGDGSTGQGVNYLNLKYSRRAFGSGLGLYTISEQENSTGGLNFNSVSIPRNEWFTLQMATKISSASLGGHIRIWLNDEFVGELATRTTNSTLKSIGRWGIGDYWNGVPWTDNDPSTTDMFYVDEIILASDYGPFGSPLVEDAGGRLYIPSWVEAKHLCGQEYTSASTATSNPVVNANLTVSGWNQEVTDGGVIAGPAPLGVFFDAIGTTHSDNTINTYRELGYHFDFGYETASTPGTWTYNGEDKGNQIGGPLASHVYETTGTYIASVRAQDEYGRYSDTFVTIEVLDPDVYYAGTATVCISLAGNFSDIPTGATTSTSVPTSLNSSTRYLFRCGEVFSGTNVTVLHSRENIQIGSYGTGPKPMVRLTLRQRPPTTGEYRQRCITVYDIASTARLSPEFADYVTYLRVDSTSTNGFYAGTLVNYYYSNPVSNQDMTLCTWPKNLMLHDSYIDTNFAEYDAYFLATRYSLQGNYMINPDEHVVRIPLTYKGFIAHNYFGAIQNDTKAQLKMHSAGSSTFTYNLAVTQTPMSRYMLVADNYVPADANNWQFNMQPQNGQSYEVLQDGIYERNIFDSDPLANGSQKAETAGATRITYRDTIVAPRAASNNIGINNHSDPGGDEGGIPPELMGPYYVPAGNSLIDNVQVFENTPTVLPNKAGA